MKADRLAGIAGTGAGIVLAAAASQLEILTGQPTLSARFFPYLLSCILIFGGLLLALKPGSLPLATVIEKLLRRRGLAFAAVFLIYALTFRYADFRLGTWAFVLAAMWILGSRSRLELTLLPLAISATTYLLFRYGFTVLLPVWT